MAGEPQVGETFARYRLDAVIGRGGVGVVYRAHDLNLERDVALKVLSEDLAASASYRARFLREARILGSIDEPHVIPIFDSGESDGVLYIAMRLVTGTDLATKLREDGRLQPREAVDIVTQLGEALDAAHERGLIHRDVKPGNVLLARRSGRSGGTHAYLSDFGLTKEVTDGTNLTLLGQIAGTPGYVAPEQIEGNPVDRRADVYALGCLLYTALTGKVTYERDSLVSTLSAQLTDAPPKPSLDIADLPSGFDAVIAKAMARAPKDRYPTAGDLAEAAAAALDPSTARAAGVAGAAAALAGPATVLDLPGGQETVVGQAGSGPETVIDHAGMVPAPGGPAPTIIASGDTVLPNQPITPADVGGMPTMIVGAGAVGAGAATAAEGTVLGETAFDVIAPRPDPDSTASFAEAGPAPAGTTNTMVDDRMASTKGRRRRAPALAAAGIAAVLVAGTVAASALLNPRGSIEPSPSDQGVARGNPSVMEMPSDAASIPVDSLASVAPSVAPTPTPTPPPKPKPPASPEKPVGPPPDTSPPTGGAIGIAHQPVVTSPKLTITIKKAPSDASKITRMALSFSSTKRSNEGAYATRTITLPSGTKAGVKTVYAWFRDAGGYWSRTPVKASIKFDNKPVARDRSYDFTSNAWCNYLANNNGIVPLYVIDTIQSGGDPGTDADGKGTIHVSRAWIGTSTALTKWTNGKGYYVYVSPYTNINRATFTTHYEIEDTYHKKDTGTIKYTVGPCP